MRPLLRRRWIAVLTVAAVAAGITTIALAQGTTPVQISAQVSVTPNKAGTKKHPQGVKIKATGEIKVPDDYDPPLVNTVDVWISKGGLYNGAKFPSCSQQTLARKGVGGCPKGSIMGSGSGDATADTVATHPKITIVNGGGKLVWFYTVLKNPARVAAPVPGVITKLSGKWSYKVHVTIPHTLQVVAGIPIRVSRIRGSAGRGDWLATTSCPSNHRWAYHTEVNFTTGEKADYDGSVGCR